MALVAHYRRPRITQYFLLIFKIPMNPQPVTVVFELRKTSKGLEAYRTLSGDEEVALGVFPLLPDDELVICGKKVKVGEFCKDLLSVAINDPARQSWADRGQLEIGRKLGDAILSKLPPGQRGKLLSNEVNEVFVDVVFPSADSLETHDLAFLLSIPWPTLYWEGEFRCRTGWSIAVRIGNQDKGTEVQFLKAPRILVIAPQTGQRCVPLTQENIEEHVNAFEQMLRRRDENAVSNDRWRRVTSWNELVPALQNFRPDILYFFGHGRTDADNGLRLSFGGRGGDRSPSDLQAALAAVTPSATVCVAYMNCCFGNAGDHLGLGPQLLGRVPCVVTNRTSADADVAGRQAVRFFEHLIFEAGRPETAVAALYRSLGEGETTKLPIWFTPVLFKNYIQWKPARRASPDRFRGWRSALDRTSQFHEMVVGCQEAMRNDVNRKGLAYIWYGSADAQPELLHRRVELKLAEKIGNQAKIFFRPMQLPGPILGFGPGNPLYGRQCFQAPFLGALFQQKTDWDDIQTRLLQEYPGGGHPVWIYLSISSAKPKLLTPDVLEGFLSWCDGCIPEILPSHVRLLIGVDYQVADSNEAKALRDELDKKKIGRRRSQTKTKVLDGLGSVSFDELREFVEEMYDCELNDEQRGTLRKIVAEADGVYSAIIDKLIVHQFFPSDLN